jgi:hypothetical protein
MNQSLSIFARALASENISFAFNANAETASFDVKNRHLTLPVWDVSETVQTMLIAHEISHALWTPYERSEEILNAAEKEGYNRTLLQRVANVVEDVRIEKLMKAKYPGTRRDFFLGYKEIVDADLFQFKGKDWSDANIITRLNIYCKWGVPGFIDITLNADEMGFVSDIDAAQSIDDVYEVAKRIYRDNSMKSAREEYEDGEKTKSKQGLTPDNNGELIEGDTSNIGKKDGDQFISSSLTLTGLKNYRNGIITTDMVLGSFEDRNREYPLNLDEYRTFVKDSDAFVRQLVAQFERKKAADEIRRERPKQTGMLNLDRLHQYRTHDDIFISKIIKQDGKNHGIVFMLDFSGSMGNSLKDCYLQILQLVWFCEKAKIPFEVFGFTDVPDSYCVSNFHEQYRDWHNNPKNHGKKFTHPMMMEPSRECPNMMMYADSRLINLASSQDDAAKRERLLAYLYGSFVTNTNCGSDFTRLHGTPTVECLAIATQFMQEWVAANNIQIPTLMIVTDGQPNGIEAKDHNSARLYYHNGVGTLTVVNDMTGTTHRLDYSDFQGLDFSNTVISTMLDSLRTTLNARIVGMFVGGNTFNEGNYGNFCMSRREREEYWNTLNHSRPDVTDSPRFKAAKESYADGAILVHPDIFPGYDAYFLIRTPKIVKDEDAIKDGNFTKVKNAFVKTMAKRSGSRVFLTRYVDIVAGQPINRMKDAIYNHPAF